MIFNTSSEFSHSIALASTIILGILLYWQIKCWKWRVMLSPGFYFAAFWILGTIGSSIFIEAGFLSDEYPKELNELNLLVGFTGLCFLFVTSKGKHKILNSKTIFNCLPSNKVFTIVSTIVLTLSLINFISHGASFNMGAAREAVHENVANQAFWVGYSQVLGLALSIVAGIFLCQIYLNERNASIKFKIVLLFPLIAQLFFSIYLGGRVNFIYCTIQYAIGFFLYLPFKIQTKLSKKLIFICLIIGTLLSLFISIVSTQREEHYTGGSSKFTTIVGDNKILSILYGPMEYMTASYLGYEWRRNDAVDLNDLTYGTRTLNGFINWSIPFSAKFGLEKFTIADLLDIRYNNQETYDFEREYYYTTNSCYIPIVKDFGLGIGTLLFIYFLVWIAHKLFISIQAKKEIRYMCSFFFFYLFLEYWIKSNFYGTLSNAVMMNLYGFIIFDLINRFTSKKK